MRVSIGHVTSYSYQQPALRLTQALRLTPPSFAGQRVIEWTIQSPGIDKAGKFRDGFGNQVHLVSLTAAHDEVLIIAKGVIETQDTAGVVRGLSEPSPARVYLRATPQTRAGDNVAALAGPIGRAPGLEGLHELMRNVRDAVDYEVGTTHQHTSAEEALADGKGVCQDHAHVFIAAARHLGVPARYVNGYLYADSGQAAAAHHAWAEALVPQLGWVGFDPANRVCPTDHYIRLATGLDAASAAPIRGSRRGGAEEALDVTVQVQQHSVQQ
jgi:transglutaminase-like putative cysteine protease